MKLPTLRPHRASGQYRASFNGVYQYFGTDWPKAEERFRQRLAEHVATKGRRDQVPIARVVADVIEWARGRYAPSGRWGGNAEVIRCSLAQLDRTVAVKLPDRPPQSVALMALPANDFTAIHLAAVQEAMIRTGYARSYINSSIRDIQQAFQQARVMGLIRAEVVADVLHVRPVPMGHARVHEPPPVGPVDDARLNTILPLLSGPMRAIVEILRHTGMRVGELVNMTVGSVDRSTDPKIWRYDLGTQHKTGRTTGRSRVIFLGPKAQQALGPWLDRAMLARRLDAPVWPAMSRNNQTDRVTTAAVRDAIEGACRRAGVECFTTHQLRHSRATEIAEREALRAVRAALGHASSGSSRVYAELDSIAREQARASG